MTQQPFGKEEGQGQEELALESAELRKKELLQALEEENQESALGRLCRSKTFWYMVFGAVFFVVMGLLLRWVARDLGYL